MTRLSPNFTLAEMTVTNTGLPNVPNAQQIRNLRFLVVNILQPLRDAIGPVKVTSGFRSKAVNAHPSVGGSSHSQHLQGLAADIVSPTGEWSPEEITRVLIDLGLPFDQLIFEGGWVHVSWSTQRRGHVLRKGRDGGYRPFVPRLLSQEKQKRIRK
jgi:zinc D-Ala-D-Ala carboxypeptidase